VTTLPVVIAIALLLLCCAGGATCGDRQSADAGSDTLRLDLGCATARSRSLVRLLSQDGIAVTAIDIGRSGETAVRVAMTAERFRSLFGGTVAARNVARSSGDGFVSQRYIVGYSAPQRYRRALRWIRLPDPQLE